MPSTLSSAATKCISEVPGLVKHTFTPPPTSVRTRLSAPFMMVPSYCMLRPVAHAHAHAHYLRGIVVKSFGEHNTIGGWAWPLAGAPAAAEGCIAELGTHRRVLQREMGSDLLEARDNQPPLFYASRLKAPGTSRVGAPKPRFLATWLWVGDHRIV